jgi:hypothetical protein
MIVNLPEPDPSGPEQAGPIADWLYESLSNQELRAHEEPPPRSSPLDEEPEPTLELRPPDGVPRRKPTLPVHRFAEPAWTTRATIDAPLPSLRPKGRHRSRWPTIATFLLLAAMAAAATALVLNAFVPGH